MHSKEQIDKFLRAGMAAPSAVNMQPWSFVAVTDRGTMDHLAHELTYAKMLSKAGAAIVICVHPAKAFEGMTEFAVIDGTLAGENILLAAEAMDLGAIWTAAYPCDDRMGIVRKALNIPADVLPLTVIPLGWPAGNPKPMQKYKPENIHWVKW